MGTKKNMTNLQKLKHKMKSKKQTNPKIQASKKNSKNIKQQKLESTTNHHQTNIKSHKSAIRNDLWNAKDDDILVKNLLNHKDLTTIQKCCSFSSDFSIKEIELRVRDLLSDSVVWDMVLESLRRFGEVRESFEHLVLQNLRNNKQKKADQTYQNTELTKSEVLPSYDEVASISRIPSTFINDFNLENSPETLKIFFNNSERNFHIWSNLRWQDLLVDQVVEIDQEPLFEKDQYLNSVLKINEMTVKDDENNNNSTEDLKKYLDGTKTSLSLVRDRNIFDYVKGQGREIAKEDIEDLILAEMGMLKDLETEEQRLARKQERLRAKNRNQKAKLEVPEKLQLQKTSSEVKYEENTTSMTDLSDCSSSTSTDSLSTDPEENPLQNELQLSETNSIKKFSTNLVQNDEQPKEEIKKVSEDNQLLSSDSNSDKINDKNNIFGTISSDVIFCNRSMVELDDKISKAADYVLNNFNQHSRLGVNLNGDSLTRYGEIEKVIAASQDGTNQVIKTTTTERVSLGSLKGRFHTFELSAKNSTIFGFYPIFNHKPNHQNLNFEWSQSGLPESVFSIITNDEPANNKMIKNVTDDKLNVPVFVSKASDSRTVCLLANDTEKIEEMDMVTVFDMEFIYYGPTASK